MVNAMEEAKYLTLPVRSRVIFLDLLIITIQTAIMMLLEAINLC